ncbi:MAG: hypothetical protein QM766_20610 [Burkholderiaceae bacterium]
MSSPLAGRGQARLDAGTRQRLLAALKTTLHEHSTRLQAWHRSALAQLSDAFARACAGRGEESASLVADLENLRARTTMPSERIP